MDFGAHRLGGETNNQDITYCLDDFFNAIVAEGLPLMGVALLASGAAQDRVASLKKT